MTIATTLPNPFHFASPTGRPENDRLANPAIAAVPAAQSDRFAENMAKIERIESVPHVRQLTHDRQRDWDTIRAVRDNSADQFEAVCFLMMKDLADIVAGIDARRAVKILQEIAS